MSKCISLYGCCTMVSRSPGQNRLDLIIVPSPCFVHRGQLSMFGAISVPTKPTAQSTSDPQYDIWLTASLMKRSLCAPSEKP